MREIGILVSAVLILLMSTHTFAQDSTQTPKTSSPAAQSERPKTEVDHQIEEAKKHGDMVLVRRLENYDEKEKSKEMLKPVAHSSYPGRIIPRLHVEHMQLARYWSRCSSMRPGK